MLESIYVSSHGKTYRTSKDQELIKFGADFLSIEIKMDKADREENIKIRITNNKEKNIQINNKKTKKNGNFFYKHHLIYVINVAT